MSLRYFSVRLFKNGRFLLQKICKLNTSSAVVENTFEVTKSAIKTSPQSSRAVALRNAGLSLGSQARRIFFDTILNKVSTSVGNDLKKKLTRRLFSGDAVPVFAFIGVTMASGSGLMTREDLLEGLCIEIRDAISKFHWNIVSLCENEAVFALEEVSLDRLIIGPPISKGCSAVVYAAKLKDEMSQMTKLTLDDDESVDVDLSQFPLALKMMFNYDIESNAMSILRAMYRETVPARRYFANEEAASWENNFTERKVILPPHPNVVAMYSVFADFVPQLSGNMRLYPDVLPTRINPEGYGRNMTLFLLMKRYQYSLVDFLKVNKLPPRDSILLLAQLLEGVTHINMYGIAHRDLKSDNILVDALFTEETRTVPVLVITDFGCCLADYENGLQIPYNSEQIDKGGNAALMAPEIALQKPGPFSVLNYTKSDVWAVGTIAYEIFDMDNPFYRNADRQRSPLRNTTYDDKELPQMGENVPPLIRRLVLNLLSRNPNNRLSAELAANVCQLYLWAPSDWLKSKQLPTSIEILKWLLCLTTKVFYEGRLNYPQTTKTNSKEVATKHSRSTHPEYVLISSFLGRARLAQIRQALSWIQHGH